MKENKIIERSHNFAEPYCVRNGEKFRLKDVDPGDTGDFRPEDEPGVEEALQSEPLFKRLYSAQISSTPADEIWTLAHMGS